MLPKLPAPRYRRSAVPRWCWFALEVPLRPSPLLVLIASFGAAIISSRAHADEEDEFARANRFRGIALLVNPLNLVYERLSTDVQWLPVSHHAITLNVFGYLSDQDDSKLASRFDFAPGYGSELGYRMYTGDRGANGLFLGGSLFAGHTAASPPADQTYLGAALEVGAQAIFDNGFTIGGGGGVHWRQPLDAHGWLSPRLLLALGWSF